MRTSVCWKVSFSASCVHLVTAMRSGLPLVDLQLAALTGLPAEALYQELQSSCGSVDGPLQLLLALASEEENNRRLAELVLVKWLGRNGVSTTAIERLTGSLSDLEAVVLRENPQFVDELAVRGGPLRVQWDTQGPGLLKRVGHLTEEALIPEAAEVILVMPYLGGHGAAHLRQQRVTFEGVLANPHEDLPEVLRLVWLVSQLNLDLPKYSEVLTPGRLEAIAALAMLPPTLAAADFLGMVNFDRALLERALQVWHLDLLLPTEGVDRLEQWWSTLEAKPVAWSIALAALDQMLAI